MKIQDIKKFLYKKKAKTIVIVDNDKMIHVPFDKFKTFINRLGTGTIEFSYDDELMALKGDYVTKGITGKVRFYDRLSSSPYIKIDLQ